MHTATARWSGTKTTFVIESGTGHEAVADEPPVLGADQGMRPTEMLLGALGSCTGINAVLLLRKFRQRYRSLAVEVEGDQDDDWPKAFNDIRISFVIEWEDGFEPEPEKVEEALDMACNRYCPVDATLTKGVRITHSYRVAEEPVG
ncbi:MAG TPA: OsmC family protein [Candidatus Dormibacteraeota bacterium]|jgi:putative redox protein|nr:OsmC family protein [Candidatus Dormibacteraeota bacterium]